MHARFEVVQQNLNKKIDERLKSDDFKKYIMPYDGKIQRCVESNEEITEKVDQFI